MVRLADLTYSEEELEQDAVNYFKTAVYEPAYAARVKDFIAADLADFTDYYNDEQYKFCNLYADEFQQGYVDDGNTVAPRADYNKMMSSLAPVFQTYDVDDEDLERYLFALEAEFRKNAFCSHMEPYFVQDEAVIATVMTGYARNPLFSIYSMVREWCMALHFKFMYPELMRKFGYRYQIIRTQWTGEERLRRLIRYRDKYKLTFQNIGALRAIHSSVFAYVYLYLRGIKSNETALAERFILDSSSSQIYLLLQGESIQNIDFPVVEYALQRLKEGDWKKLFLEDGSIAWGAIYAFVMEAIKSVGNIDKLRHFGVDSIGAKSIQSFWNKSANMQSMLKILRRLAMDNSDPIFNRLIRMCEYRLGRPDTKKEKMERFIEETRRILAARSYELTKPRTMDQTLIAAFPSVFLVYFQWHHNFRNVYPKVPKKQIDLTLQNQQKLQAEEKLKNRIYADDRQQIKFREIAREQTQKKTFEQERRDMRLRDELQTKNTADNSLRMVIDGSERNRLQEKERVQARDEQLKIQTKERSANGAKEENSVQSKNNTATLAAELSQRQNSL